MVGLISVRILTNCPYVKISTHTAAHIGMTANTHFVKMKSRCAYNATDRILIQKDLQYHMIDLLKREYTIADSRN